MYWTNDLTASAKNFAPLARVEPVRVAGYCTRGLSDLVDLVNLGGHRLTKRWVRALVGAPHLVVLARHSTEQSSLGTLLPYLLWLARGQLYKQVYPMHPQSDNQAKDFTDQLPQDVSIDLATHILQIQTDATPQGRLHWYAYLPTQDPSAL